MKKFFPKFIFTVLITSAALLVAGCGSGTDSSTNNGATAAPAVATTCSAGYVYSNYGCIPQSSCPAGYGLYNNSCVAATTSSATSCTAGYVYSTYGCIPQSSCPSGYGLYNNSCVPATASSAVSCTAGTVYTSYGCVPQSGCPSGYGLYNNSCVPVTGVANGGIGVGVGGSSCQGSCQAGYVITQYGCLPQYSCASCYGYYNGYCWPAY